MSRLISAETCVLVNVPESHYTRYIDSIIATCIVECRPVYLDVPLDYNHIQVPTASLSTPLVRLLSCEVLTKAQIWHTQAAVKGPSCSDSPAHG